LEIKSQLEAGCSLYKISQRKIVYYNQRKQAKKSRGESCQLPSRAHHHQGQDQKNSCNGNSDSLSLPHQPTVPHPAIITSQISIRAKGKLTDAYQLIAAVDAIDVGAERVQL
jgi:hypothetical protein